MHSSACVTDCFGSGTVGCTLVSQEGCEAAPGLPGKRGNALIPLGWTQNKRKPRPWTGLAIDQDAIRCAVRNRERIKRCTIGDHEQRWDQIGAE